MTDEITYAEFGRFLRSLGLVSWRGRRPKGAAWPGPDTFVVWEHPAYPDGLLTLPDYKPEDAVRPHHLVAARGILDNFGLLSRDDFDRWRLGQTRPSPPKDKGVKRSRKKKKAGAGGADKK